MFTTHSGIVLPTNEGLLRAFLEAETKVVDTFNSNISVKDEMYLFLLDQLKGNVDEACIEYLRTGKQMLNMVKQVVEWRFGGFENVPTFLDFASGYGRFTRFLIQEIPPERIWSVDIDANAVAFQREQFGVNGIVSVARPEDYRDERRYNCIFVASLFSHLPESSFRRWLQELYLLLDQSGVLMFSVHDVAIMPPELKMRRGILYILRSETKRLDPREYGTTYVNETFVCDVVNEVTNRKVQCFRIPRGLCGYQDLYLVVNRSEAISSNPEFCLGPVGALDSYLVDDKGIHLSGWAIDLCKDTHIEDVQIFLNGHLVVTCHPAHDRSDISAAFHDNRGTRSGWSCDIPDKETRPTDIVVVKAINHRNLASILRNSPRFSPVR